MRGNNVVIDLRGLVGPEQRLFVFERDGAVISGERFTAVPESAADFLEQLFFDSFAHTVGQQAIA